MLFLFLQIIAGLAVFFMFFVLLDKLFGENEMEASYVFIITMFAICFLTIFGADRYTNNLPSPLKLDSVDNIRFSTSSDLIKYIHNSKIDVSRITETIQNDSVNKVVIRRYEGKCNWKYDVNDAIFYTIYVK